MNGFSLKHGLAACGALFVFGAPSLTSAQSQNPADPYRLVDPFLACVDIDDVTERVACYDRAAMAAVRDLYRRRTGARASGPNSVAEPGPAAAQKPATADRTAALAEAEAAVTATAQREAAAAEAARRQAEAAAARQEAEARAAALAARERELAAQAEEIARQKAALAEQTAALEEDRQPAPPSQSRLDVLAALPGSEILDRNNDGAIISVRVPVESFRFLRGDIQLRLSDGQVWQQTDGAQVKTRRTAETHYAVLKQGALGNYLLRVDGIGPWVTASPAGQ